MNESDSQYRRGAGLAVVALVLALLTGCGSGDDSASGDRATVVVTTNILGDVVERAVGDEVDVITVMPVGADPHSFQASARQADEIRRADAIVVNGGGFERGLLDLVEAAESDGVPVLEAVTVTDPIGSGDDPHFFTDPRRMQQAVTGIVDFLSDVEGVDAEAVERAADAYAGELAALDEELVETLAVVPAGDRVLVTNHDVFGAFADRYDFEVVGAVIPAGSTAEGASAGDLARLADTVRAAGVDAVFSDTSASDDLVQTLADEVGDVEVVALFSESLGGDGSGAESYVSMLRTDGERIAAALGSA